MPAILQDSCGFDARLARKVLLKHGIIAVLDPLGDSIPSIQDELFDALGHAADAMDITVNKVATAFGAVYAFRDKRRMPLQLAREIVFLHAPKPK
jgi:hypothetical protein